MNAFTFASKTISVFPAQSPTAPCVYVNSYGDNGGELFKTLAGLGCPDCSLVVVSALDWNRELSPWQAPSPWKNEESFSGGADEYLDLLAGKIIVLAESRAGIKPVWRAVAGYSLAGLFALYSLFKTDAFTRAVSASGSLWFPGFLDFVKSHDFKGKPDALYLSLGDKECKTKNAEMQTVRQNTDMLAGYFSSRGITTKFEMNPGNHFTESILRTAKGIAWICKDAEGL